MDGIEVRRRGGREAAMHGKRVIREGWREKRLVSLWAKLPPRSGCCPRVGDDEVDVVG